MNTFTNKATKILPYQKQTVIDTRTKINNWIGEYNLTKMLYFFSMSNTYYKVAYKYLEPEQIFHIFVYQFILHYHNQDVEVWHTENESKRNHVQQAKSLLMGVTKGVPDLIIQRKGEFAYPLLFIELKIKGNYPTDEQKKFIENQLKMGNHAYIVYDFPYFLEVFKNWLKNG